MSLDRMQDLRPERNLKKNTAAESAHGSPLLTFLLYRAPPSLVQYDVPCGTVM